MLTLNAHNVTSSLFLVDYKEDLIPFHFFHPAYEKSLPLALWDINQQLQYGRGTRE